jgi:DNA-binding MarR family transcriptional regulator
MTTTQGLDLRQFTGYLLRRAFVRVAAVTRECIPPEAHVREVAVLAILAEQGAMSQRSLSDVTHVNRSLIVKLIDKLEGRGWVVRERNADDRRSYRLRLTPDGMTALADLTADLDHGEAQITRALSAAERERLNRHLRTLLDGDPALGVTTLANRSGYLIVHAHRLLRERAELMLSDIPLHPRDFGLLTALGREQPCSQNHLAAALQVTPPVVLMFVDELGARGLVTRARNAQDRRSYDVSLTPQGHEVLRIAQRSARRLQAQLVDQLGADADVELRELLARVISSAE